MRPQSPADHMPLIPRAALCRRDSDLTDSTADQDTLKTKRAAVQRALTRDLDQHLVPLGYTRDGDTWRKSGPLATSALQFQKSHYGFEAFFNASAGLRWTAQTPRLHRLAAFCPELGNTAPDALPYLRLHDDPAFRAAVLTVIRARMIPWLQAHHTPFGLARRLLPQDMRRVPVFHDPTD